MDIIMLAELRRHFAMKITFTPEEVVVSVCSGHVS